MSQPPQDDWDEHDVRGRGARFEDDLLGLRGVRQHDESLADEMLDPAPPAGTFRPRRRRRGNPVLKTLALLLAGVVFVGGAIFSFNAIRPFLPQVSLGGDEQSGPTDYEGEGSGEVTIEVPAGAAGGQIAEILAEKDVVASAGAFNAVLAAEPRASSIQPGTYRMANQMSAEAALGRLLDGTYREINGVTVREGLWVDETFALLAEATGHEVSEYEAVDPTTLDLPEAAEGELEGFLYPSTYEFPPDATPQEQLQLMVDTGKQKYAELGLSDGEELRETIIKASIVQGEGMFSQDLPKIARVIENRLQPNPDTNGFLQMDSTIHFIEQQRGLAGTTDAQRESQDRHNTYAFPGLPSGPINSPGEAAITAVMQPEPGDWMYFVTVNPDTGETVFTTNLADHNANVEKFLQWCSDNEGRC